MQLKQIIAEQQTRVCHRVHKAWILYKCARSSKMATFSFLMFKAGNALQIWLKQSPVTGKVFTNCFIKSSLICSGGIIIFDATIA